MLLGIDASRTNTRQRTGTEAYAYFLIQALIPLAAARGHRLRLYFNQAPAPNLFPVAEHVELLSLPQARLWTHSRLRNELNSRPPDVFFTPAHVIPVGYRKPSVATIHDLGYEYFPEAHPRRQLAYLRWSTRHNARVACRVIVDSRATRDDLVRLYGIESGKIEVVYPGIDPAVQRTEDAAAIESTLGRHHIHSPYLLYLGTIQPRKNLVRLIEAYALSELFHADIALVLAGKSGWLAQPILDAVARQQPVVRENIHITGYIGETEKNHLLSGAAALIFPSLYEGFGFPVLEAQACGTPVVAANTSSLPEVAGDAARLVDPQDTAALAEAMASIVADSQAREELVDRGYRNLTRFDWSAAAARVLAVLEEAAAA